MAKQTRATVYDAMEFKGVFDRNRANQHAVGENNERISDWPVAFPCMVYHPTGETEVIDHGYEETLKSGRSIQVNRLEALRNKIVETPQELAAALAAGWHRKPALAIAAAGGVAPPMAAEDRNVELVAQIEELQRKLAEREAEDAKIAEFAKDAASKPSAKTHGL